MGASTDVAPETASVKSAHMSRSISWVLYFGRQLSAGAVAGPVASISDQTQVRISAVQQGTLLNCIRGTDSQRQAGRTAVEGSSAPRSHRGFSRR